MRSIAQHIHKLGSWNRELFWVLLPTLFILAAGYIYLVHTATTNGVKWSQAEAKIEEQSGRVSELESQFLSLRRDVTLPLAYKEGFLDARNIKFISTKTLGAVTMRNEI